MRGLPAALLLLAATSAAAQDGPPPLPLGAAVKGTATKGATATFVVETKTAGVITAIVTSDAGADLALSVCDEDGQPLPDYLDPSGQLVPGARVDRDLMGGAGIESLAALAPYAGRYLVVVEVIDGADGRFTLAGSFAPAPSLARPPDPDGRPSAARPLHADAQPVQVEDAVDPRADDLRDWYAIRAGRAGTLMVVARAPEGDLRLDAFDRANVRTGVQQSDEDQGGVAGNESLSIPVREGDVVFVRVSAVFLLGERAAYHLTVAVVAQ